METGEALVRFAVRSERSQLTSSLRLFLSEWDSGIGLGTE